MKRKTALVSVLVALLIIHESEAGKLKKLLKYGLGGAALLGLSHHSHHIPLHLIGLGVGLGIASHGLIGGGGGGGGHHTTFVPYPVHYHTTSYYLHDGHHGDWW